MKTTAKILTLVIYIASILTAFGNEPTEKLIPKKSENSANTSLAASMFRINDLAYIMPNMADHESKTRKKTYIAQTAGQQVYFNPTNIIFQTKHFANIENEHKVLNHFQLNTLAVSGFRIVSSYKNLNTELNYEPIEATETKLNFYTLNQDNFLQSSLYKSLIIKNIYNGISATFDVSNNDLTTKYFVEPGFDYTQIELDFEAVNMQTDANGYLVAETGFGSIFKNMPIATQNGKPLPCYWEKSQKGTYKFILENYNSEFAVEINASWQLSGQVFDQHLANVATKMVTDKEGNQYLTGKMISLLANKKINTENEPLTDAFVAKLNPKGEIAWISFYGGQGFDIGLGLTTDEKGFVYLSGLTTSKNNIATNGAYKTKLDSEIDGFVVKFNQAGIRQWGTYYGGNGSAFLNDITTDSSGDVYLSGESNGLELSANTTNRGSMLKFNAIGSFQWGTL